VWRCTSRSDWPASLTWDRWSALSQWAGKPHSIAGTLLMWAVVFVVRGSVGPTSPVNLLDLFALYQRCQWARNELGCSPAFFQIRERGVSLSQPGKPINRHLITILPKCIIRNLSNEH
jgi:hypothetical protein